MVGSSDGERELADALIKVYIHFVVMVVKFPSTHEESHKKAEEMRCFLSMQLTSSYCNNVPRVVKNKDNIFTTEGMSEQKY